MITVVGMGRKQGDLTLDGKEAIQNADVVVCKSENTHMKQTLSSLVQNVVYCDDLYNEAEDFDELNKAIINRLQSFGNKKVAFCVVGEGSDDSTVQVLDTPFDVVHGVSIGASAVSALAEGVRYYNAIAFTTEQNVIAVPTVIKCIDDEFVASDVELKLFTAFDEDTTAVYFDGEKSHKIQICDLHRQAFSYQSALYVCPKAFTERQVFGFYDALDVMRILRSPNGCPWDKEQTHNSITVNVIEEAYELVNAIQNDDVNNIVEELGDLLMQVVFHQVIARQEGEFAEEEVYSTLCRKLINRHPHVFGNVKVDNAEDSLVQWNAVKAKEHKIKDTSQNLLDVPHDLPALVKAEKIQSRASKGGYEFQNVEQCVGKVTEELNEFLQECKNNGDGKEMEAGDLLFAVVNVLRLSGVAPETALLLSTEKFTKRVCRTESLLKSRGQKLQQLTPEQFDEVWEEAKRDD